MPEAWMDLVREGGPVAVVATVAIYLLLRDFNNRRNSNPGNPGNPGPPLVNGRWQEEMRDAQREGNEKLGRIEKSMDETVKLLRLMEDREKRERGGN